MTTHSPNTEQRELAEYAAKMKKIKRDFEKWHKSHRSARREDARRAWEAAAFFYEAKAARATQAAPASPEPAPTKWAGQHHHESISNQALASDSGAVEHHQQAPPAPGQFRATASPEPQGRKIMRKVEVKMDEFGNKTAKDGAASASCIAAAEVEGWEVAPASPEPAGAIAMMRKALTEIAEVPTDQARVLPISTIRNIACRALALTADASARAPASPNTGAVDNRRCKPCGATRGGDKCWKCGADTFTPDPRCGDDPALPPIDRIRELAKEVGYAIGVHGSQQRDFDVIAAPWTDAAIGNHALLVHLAKGLATENGPAHIISTERKPLGRYSATIQMDGWYKQLDISVCPNEQYEYATPATPSPSKGGEADSAAEGDES